MKRNSSQSVIPESDKDQRASQEGHTRGPFEGSVRGSRILQPSKDSLGLLSHLWYSPLRHLVEESQPFVYSHWSHWNSASNQAAILPQLRTLEANLLCSLSGFLGGPEVVTGPERFSNALVYSHLCSVTVKALWNCFHIGTRGDLGFPGLWSLKFGSKINSLYSFWGESCVVFMNRIFDKIITLFFSTELGVAFRLGNWSFSTFPFPFRATVWTSGILPRCVRLPRLRL